MTITDYLTTLDTPLRKIGEELRAVVDAALQMASVKITSTDDVDPALFTDWLRQAGDLEKA